MRHQLVLSVLLLALIFMPAASGLPDGAVGRVVTVISGDSLGVEMLIADGRTNAIDSIKLADIIAPSTVTEQGKASQKYALSLLKNKMVYLDINDNNSTRNEYNQLLCVIYLMDSEYRPIWPPVNRILVEDGHARQVDDPNTEFDPSSWWKPPPVFPPGEKRDQLIAMLEKAKQAEEMALAAPSPIQPAIMNRPNSSMTAGSSASSFAVGSSKKGSVLEKDASSGRISIGYRK
jgi:endonuclease YncB( thermonuclease family)